LQILSSHITNNTSVLVLGGSGGTGHVAIQVANCLGAGSVVVVCSSKNESFCRSLGATEVIDYTAGNILDDLHKSSSKPFSVVMDCVTSADPRDQALDYPNRIQHSAGLLADDYIYRRLGGPSADWIRAGLERTAGLNFWKDKPEQLFWVRFPKSAGELQQLREWAEAGKLTPHISKSYDFTEADVRDAFHAILSRRIQGKVVVRIHSDDVETKDKSIQ
jgi:NADPH:quinone reductase-like Zn-dependent oxidoreductase